MAFMDDPLWYKDAIIYELHVKAFNDANGDGIGDFRGLIDKLDYLEELGVNTLWLLPFYPSPMRDDGYDIADYHNVHPDYGTRQDVRALIKEVHRRGMRLITELVINHTSDQHPWFQAARRAPKGSAKRNYYVWSDDPERFADTRIIFTDSEESNWAWDPVAKSYYWHRFFSHQPDLNFDNPSVIKAVIRTMRFWLDMGVDGLRLDAIPYLVERDGSNNENLPETHAVIKHIRSVVDTHYQDRMLLAEANQWPEDVRQYFGQGDECHMAYHFPIMPRMYMALAQEDRYPLVDILNQTPAIPDNCQWAIFLRNHDELTLEMVTDKERDYMYQTYASDPRMRVNVGIRRRLAPLLDNDLEKIKLLNCLLMSMPGAPIIYYGDEIGMGDNIFLGDRNGVRTPMQWSPDRNAGFSRADPQRLYLPPIMDPLYGFQAVNVEAQTRNPSSLLNWMRRLIAVRRSHPALGRGDLKLLAPGNRKVFAYLRTHEKETILCVANLSHTPQAVELALADYRGHVPVELGSRNAFPPIGDLPYLLTLPRYGFLWFLLSSEASAPVWHTDRPAVEDLPILVLTESRGFFMRKPEPDTGYIELVAPEAASSLERHALPRYFKAQHWFRGKPESLGQFEFRAWGAWQHDNARWLFATLDTRQESGSPTTFFLPLTMKWGIDASDMPLDWLSRLITRVRRKAEVGVLLDATGDNEFCRSIAQDMGRTDDIPLTRGRLRFKPTRSYHDWVRGPGVDWEVTRPSLKQSHTSVLLGNSLFLKIYRLIEPGIHPEWELGRFLTDNTPFDRIPPLLGAMFYQGNSGEPETLLALLHGYIDNQGTAWDYTLNHLGRALEGLATASTKPDHAGYCALLCKLGQRLGELHQALAIPSVNPDFGRAPLDAKQADTWVQDARKSARHTLDALAKRLADFGDSLREQAESLLARYQELDHLFTGFDFAGLSASQTRLHGDFHLWRALVAQNDVYITGLQGAAKPEFRRAKHSPLKDVAGLLYSMDQAAHIARLRLPCDSPATCLLLEHGLAEWQDLASREFLAGYRQGIGDCPSYPSSEHHAKQLLQLFVLENLIDDLASGLSGPTESLQMSLSHLEARLTITQRG